MIMSSYTSPSYFDSSSTYSGPSWGEMYPGDFASSYSYDTVLEPGTFSGSIGGFSPETAFSYSGEPFSFDPASYASAPSVTTSSTGSSGGFRLAGLFSPENMKAIGDFGYGVASLANSIGTAIGRPPAYNPFSPLAKYESEQRRMASAKEFADLIAKATEELKKESENKNNDSMRGESYPVVKDMPTLDKFREDLKTPVSYFNSIG